MDLGAICNVGVVLHLHRADKHLVVAGGERAFRHELARGGLASHGVIVRCVGCILRLIHWVDDLPVAVDLAEKLRQLVGLLSLGLVLTCVS